MTADPAMTVDHHLQIDGRTVPVTVKRSPVAGNMSLRIDHGADGVILVLPPHVPVGRGLDFARSKSGWIASRLAALPPRVLFADGAVLPLLGVDHALCAAPTARRGVWAEAGRIFVSGQPDYFSRRVEDWLRREALAEVTRRALPMAAEIGETVGRIAVRDTRSRWGSCTSQGHLAFSWRLVLAPAEVLNYVVAHEVAHLLEMNHSPAFWRVVEALAPRSKAHRDWLKRHGARLHRYG